VLINALRKVKNYAGKSSEPIREDTYDFLENGDLILVSSKNMKKNKQ
jgi:hypothetical protein